MHITGVEIAAWTTVIGVLGGVIFGFFQVRAQTRDQHAREADTRDRLIAVADKSGYDRATGQLQPQLNLAISQRDDARNDLVQARSEIAFWRGKNNDR